MRQGLGAWREAGVEVGRPASLLRLAEQYGSIGQVEEGLNLLTEARELMPAAGEWLFEAKLHRLKGELTFQSQGESHKSKIEEAEACFLKAIEISQKQQAKSLELRATISLVRLWQQQGKRHEAREKLAVVYNWFTEGFDTRDLREAKELLEELI